jgi:hypothetical protein
MIESALSLQPETPSEQPSVSGPQEPTPSTYTSSVSNAPPKFRLLTIYRIQNNYTVNNFGEGWPPAQGRRRYVLSCPGSSYCTGN